ncbi:12105_t:CDS:2 [Entrophospora sp. SA101]|nr:12105_t:CDS:2 [Entrophospora sp. SA101]
MANGISLNCLVIPSESLDILSRHSVITLDILTDKKVDKLRPMIKERWPSLFENILPHEFVLRKIDNNVTTSTSQQIELYKNGYGENGDEMFPDQLISKHFNIQPPNDKIHIIVQQDFMRPRCHSISEYLS